MKVAVTWELYGYVDIPYATTMEEAMDVFNQESDYIKLPSEAEYVYGSFRLITEDVDEMKVMCNN